MSSQIRARRRRSAQSGRNARGYAQAGRRGGVDLVAQVHVAQRALLHGPERAPSLHINPFWELPLAPTHKPSEKDMTICHMIALLLLALELFGHRHDRELRGPGTPSLNPHARSLYSDDVNPRTPWRAHHGAAARSSSRASSTPKRPPAVRIQASAREGSRWQRRRQTARPPLHTYIHTHRRTQTRFYHNNNNNTTPLRHSYLYTSCFRAIYSGHLHSHDSSGVRKRGAGRRLGVRARARS